MKETHSIASLDCLTLPTSNNLQLVAARVLTAWMTTFLCLSLHHGSFTFTSIDDAFHFSLSSIRRQKKTSSFLGFPSLGPAWEGLFSTFRPCNWLRILLKNYLVFATEPHDNSIVSLQCIFLKYRGTLKQE